MEAETQTVAKAAKAPKRKRETVKLTKGQLNKLLADTAAKAVDDATARLLAKLSEKREESGVLAPADAAAEDAATAMMRKLALAIGEISDQGNNKKIVAPEELEARNTARLALEEAIIEMHVAREKADAEGDEHALRVATPIYELRGKVYLDEQVVEPTWVDQDRRRRVTSIDWDGMPNELMVPANEAARKIHRLFMRSIGGRTAEAKVPYKRAAERFGLRVHQPKPEDQPPEVSQPRHQGVLRVHRQMAPGQVQEVNVLGTVAKPARQLAA